MGVEGGGGNLFGVALHLVGSLAGGTIEDNEVVVGAARHHHVGLACVHVDAQDRVRWCTYKAHITLSLKQFLLLLLRLFLPSSFPSSSSSPPPPPLLLLVTPYSYLWYPLGYPA